MIFGMFPVVGKHGKKRNFRLRGQTANEHSAQIAVETNINQREMWAASWGELIAASVCAGCSRIVFFAGTPLVFGDTDFPDLACARKSCRNLPSL